MGAKDTPRCKVFLQSNLPVTALAQFPIIPATLIPNHFFPSCRVSQSWGRRACRHPLSSQGPRAEGTEDGMSGSGGKW